MKTETHEILAANEEHSGEPQLQLIKNVPSKVTDGRDELNFAEFPLSAISGRVDPAIKTLVFEDRIFDRGRNEQIARKLTITSSDAYGLPTPMDEEVLLALIQLSKLQNFASKRVYFTRYQLLQLLKWPPNGQSYERLEQALNRWMGVTMYYKNAWRDKPAAKWVDESFHMLERVRISKGRGGDQSSEPELCYFEWNDVVFKSFCNGNVKSLNYDLFLSIESSIAKRLYRFLDKRFYHQRELECDLKNLAYEHIGVSRNTLVSDLKRKLNAAIDELEEKSFLAPIPKEDRYIKSAPGVWKVVFRKAQALAVVGNSASVQQRGAETLDERLQAFGVSSKKTEELLVKFDKALIEEKLKAAEWLREKKDSRISLNPPGYLIRSIEQSFTAPKQMALEIEKEVTQRKSTERELERQRKLEEKREREEQQAKEQREKIDAFWNELDPSIRIQIEEDALRNITPAKAAMIAAGGRAGEVMRQNVLDAHALEILANG